MEDAEKCLSAGTELKLNNQILDPHKALHRSEVNEKNQEKTKKEKDSRNLYLVKEGGKIIDNELNIYFFKNVNLSLLQCSLQVHLRQKMYRRQIWPSGWNWRNGNPKF